ncbi:MAG: SIMPL domain-containing protein [Armatimonadota bacterium]
MIFRSLALLLTSVFALTGAAYPQDQQKLQLPLTFRVTGQAESMPEVIILHFTIVGDGESLAKAQEQLEQTEQTVVKAIENCGVKRDQLITDRFSIKPLQPNLGYSSQVNPTSIPALGYRAQRAYSISQSANTQSMEKLIQIADVALQNGARPTVMSDEMSGGESYGDRQSGILLEFTVRDPDTLLKKAIADAVTRAYGLAEEASKQMAKRSLHMVAFQLFNSSSRSQNWNGFSASDDSRAATYTWQPITMTIDAEVGFICE